VFTLLLRFCRDGHGIAPEKLRLEQIDVSLVEAFLDYLERERKSSPSTRNHRLATLHAFFGYVQAEEPAHMLQCQKLLAIPLRRHARRTVGYVSKEELAEILAQSANLMRDIMLGQTSRCRPAISGLDLRLHISAVCA